ncbi:hypothetical protein MMC07_000175 [Pseudocyphellaria aurata]|nr:hypothetical protein [Pseudocyphellaria aurata]
MPANNQIQKAAGLKVCISSPASTSTSSIVTILPYRGVSTKKRTCSKTDASIRRVKVAGNPCVRLISSIKPAPYVSSSDAATRCDPNYRRPAKPQIRYGDLTPEILEILKHQKDSRYRSVPQPFSDPPPEISQEIKNKEFTYARCNQCSPNGAYTYCTHEEDDGPFDTTVNIDRIRENIQAIPFDTIPDEPPASIKELEYEMFKSDALSALLSENTDENASHYVVFTSRGTLLGHSGKMSIRTGRKVAALAGLTWRANEAALLSGVELLLSASSSLLKTIAAEPNETDGTLAYMVAESEGMLAAVYYVQETILVAALAPIKAPTRKKNAAKAEKADSFKDEPATSPTTSSGNEEASPKGSPDRDFQDDASSVKGKAREIDEVKRILEQPKPGYSQQQILTWKAEGMAEALREDLRGFKLPEGAY